MSKPTIYAAFWNKVEFFRKAMIFYVEQATTVCQEALDKPTAHDRCPIVCFLVQGALTWSADAQELRAQMGALQRQAAQL